MQASKPASSTRESFIADDVGGEVHGEAEGVVELEDHFAGDGFCSTALQDGHLIVQNPEAIVQGLGEAFFLGPDDLLDVFFALQEIRDRPRPSWR